VLAHVFTHRDVLELAFRNRGRKRRLSYLTRERGQALERDLEGEFGMNAAARGRSARAMGSTPSSAPPSTLGRKQANGSNVIGACSPHATFPNLVAVTFPAPNGSVRCRHQEAREARYAVFNGGLD
jgi:hypothetical protein